MNTTQVKPQLKELLLQSLEHERGGVKVYEAIEDEEDEHLYHTRGWCRELWLPGPGYRGHAAAARREENVKPAIGAARAEQARKSIS